MITALKIQKNEYDFLDFGASKAASLEYAKDHLSGKKGLGVDLDPERVELMKKAGYNCVVGDITKLDLPSKCVRFVKMSHILEHLPDLAGVEKALEVAKKAATDFLVISGPFFDADDYLASHGLKLHWSGYPDHPCHLKVSELVALLEKLKLDDYELYLRYPITDSSNGHIHPLETPVTFMQYDPAIHPPKKPVAFTEDVWTDFVCYVRLGPVKNWDKITKAYRHQIPYIECQNGVSYNWPKSVVKKYIELDAENQAKDRQISDLKAKSRQLSDRIVASGKQLTAIKRSKSWKAARLSQKLSFTARHPRTGLKKARAKLTL